MAEVVVKSDEEAKITDKTRKESVFKILDEIKKGDPNDFATIQRGIDALSARSTEIVSQKKPEPKSDTYRPVKDIPKDPPPPPAPRSKLDLFDVNTIKVLQENMGMYSQVFSPEVVELIMDKIRDTFEFMHFKYGDKEENYMDKYWLDCPNLDAVAATSRACSYMRYMSWEAGTMASTFDMEDCADASLAYFKSYNPAYDGPQPFPFPPWPSIPESARRMHNNWLLQGRTGERSLSLYLRRRLTPISCNPSRSVFFLDGFIERNELLRDSPRPAPVGYFTEFHRFSCVMLQINRLFDGLQNACGPKELGDGKDL
ncbi:hypothetical protein PG988_010468 [Apiospora saccharicola]